MATCMLLDSGLDKRFWGEAVLTATYIQNRIPSRSVPKTPFEMWWGRKPDLSHMKVFGSEAYVHIPDVKRSKMEPKAKRLTFVGYSMEHKGYRFVDPDTDFIVISRDARFLESQNGTSSVEIPIPGSAASGKERAKEDREDSIKLIPFKEEAVSEEEQETEDDEEFSTPVPESGEGANKIHRQQRQNRAMPKRLEDYLLEYAVGTAACAVEEPDNHKEAFNDPQWRKAMAEEIDAHKRNGTWELVPLPLGRKAVGAKWVFKVKRNQEDQVVKLKARVVAQGYSQKDGIDFDQVFAPVTRQATLRTFLSVAAKHNLVVQHIDIKTAYLNGFLEEEVYMRQPPCFVTQGQEEYVCRLRRSIYGLRQSARCWHKRLNEVLNKYGFKPSSADQCLYTKTTNKEKVFLIVHVDDILLASRSNDIVKAVYRDLSKEFDLTCLGEVRHFLGVEVLREDGTFKIRLKQYIDRLITKYGMENAKTTKSPMDVNFLRTCENSDPFEDVTLYRSLVGGMLYLSVVARPDIAASTAILGRKFVEPTQADWSAAKRLLRYLKATREHYLVLGAAAEDPLVGYCDADWAGDPVSRRSTSGFIFQFAGGAVSWASRRQTCVTLSSMEAEYVALSEACQETIWLRQLLQDFGETQIQPTVMKEDNQGCIAFVNTERTSKRSKHINTRERFVQELCEKKQILLEYCCTEQMLADIMTKPLGPQKFGHFTEMLGLQDPR